MNSVDKILKVIYDINNMENTTSNTSDNTKYNNEELGALWKRTARSDGQTYLAGHIKGGELGLGEETVKVVVFSNKNKTNERAPDFRIYKSKPVQEQEQEAKASEQPEASKQPEALEELID